MDMSSLRNTIHDLHQQHKDKRREGHQDRGRGHQNDNDSYNNNPGSQQYDQRPYQGGDDDEPRRPQGQGQGGYAAPSGPPQSGRGPSSGQRPYQGDDDEPRRGQSYPSQGQGQRGYAPPSGPLPSGRGPSSEFASKGSLGGLDQGDFATDEDIDRMVTSGEFDGRQGGYGGADVERHNAHGRQDAPTG
ncbi:hypothetical protein OG21DRAFT_775079 [Imleria badia]|nr:hypothetical protein OG21DRAFT_775079 [Imleria badia]